MIHKLPLHGALLVALAFPFHADAAEVTLRAVLSGERVISATESPGTGEAVAVLADDDTLQVDMVYGGLDLGARRVALHSGRQNENGPRIAVLEDFPDGSAGRLQDVQVQLTPDQAEHVRNGESYLVVNTIGHPDGAIRGQLVLLPVRLPVSGLPAAAAVGLPGVAGPPQSEAVGDVLLEAPQAGPQGEDEDE